jgi:hypothetical protein
VWLKPPHTFFFWIKFETEKDMYKLFSVVLIVFVSGLFCFLILGILSLPFVTIGTPATGERFGTVYRVSETGFIWKTNEVEVYLGGFKGTGESMAVNTIEFSVFNDDPEKSAKIEAANKLAASGQRVCIKYEHLFIVPRWTAGTGYKIISIEPAK